MFVLAVTLSVFIGGQSAIGDNSFLDIDVIHNNSWQDIAFFELQRDGLPCGFIAPLGRGGKKLGPYEMAIDLHIDVVWMKSTLHNMQVVYKASSLEGKKKEDWIAKADSISYWPNAIPLMLRLEKSYRPEFNSLGLNRDTVAKEISAISSKLTLVQKEADLLRKQS